MTSLGSKSARLFFAAFHDSTSLCSGCQRRIATQSRAASTAASSQRRKTAREPLPLVPNKAPSRNSKAAPLQPLLKPIGQKDPPLPGDNPHYDQRPNSEKWLDYFDRHEAKRQWLKPQYQSWAEMRHHSGKRFLATPRPIIQDYALYFPNFQGYTLADPHNIYDTTKVLTGKVSIVRVMNEYWSRMQCDTYTDESRNSDLHADIERLKSKGLQFVHINITENRLKSWLVWFGRKSQRQEMPEDEWARCFMVRKGVTDYLRRDIHMPNPSVGHVYLVDQMCKIRWAGCGDATDVERDSLVSAVRRVTQSQLSLAAEKEKLTRQWTERGDKRQKAIM